MDIKEGFVICSNDIKNKIIKERKSFKNYVFLTLDELIKRIFGNVLDNALSYLVIEKNMQIDFAKEILLYMPYIDLEIDYKNDKINYITFLI